MEFERRGHIDTLDSESHGSFTVHSLELRNSLSVARSNVLICKVDLAMVTYNCDKLDNPDHRIDGCPGSSWTSRLLDELLDPAFVVPHKTYIFGSKDILFMGKWSVGFPTTPLTWLNSKTGLSLKPCVISLLHARAELLSRLFFHFFIGFFLVLCEHCLDLLIAVCEDGFSLPRLLHPPC